MDRRELDVDGDAMTTATTVTPLDHTSDAGYRTWVAEWIAQCTAVGLVQTSDTGQINTATATRPGSNTDGGYAIFRFDDSLQATAPVFVKFYFGTAASTSAGRIRAQVGTASNGSGTLSGLGSANTDTVSQTSAPPSTVANYTSYITGGSGYFGIAFKAGVSAANQLPYALFHLARTRDSTGATTGDGLITTYRTTLSSGPSARTISYSGATIYDGGEIQKWFLPFYTLSSTLVGGTPQVMKTYYCTPRVRPSMDLAGTLAAEIGVGVQFTATLVGSTSHNYMVFAASGSTFNGHNLAVLWE